MQAIHRRRYGGPEVLELVEAPAPVPAPGQALVRVRATSVNPVDWHGIRGEPLVVRASMGLRQPKQPGIGADLAGIVEAIGPGVETPRVGDEVFGMSILTWAELVAVKAEGLVAKPPGASFEELAAVPVAGITALQGLRDHGHVGPGSAVLVNGAGGGVGTFAVQIAKALGAVVTATTSSDKLELVRGLGADTVLDYGTTDPTTGPARYDVIFDASGWLGLRDDWRALRPGGIAVLSGAGPRVSLGPIAAQLAAAWILSRVGSRRFVSFLAHRQQDDLAWLGSMVASGAIRPVIDRRYPLAEIGAAVRYAETGHARGKIVVTV